MFLKAFFYSTLLSSTLSANLKPVDQFISQYCIECHDSDLKKGGLDLDELNFDLSDEASYAKWELIYDRVLEGEMPPKKKKTQPSANDLKTFQTAMIPALSLAHSKRKETVLRRLNRYEYQNTLNDLFGTNLDIAEMLPEDGRSHEFDNVGESLGMSMVQLQQYMNIAEKVLDAAIEKRPEPPVINEKVVHYNTKGAQRHIGKKWKLLEGDTVVRFHGEYYPSGLLQGTNMRQTGFYDVEITGFAYQSKEPINFAVRGKSYAQGSKTPHFGYYALPPEETTIKLRVYLEDGMMLQLEPYGINHHEPYLKAKEKFNPETYQGPGFAIKEVKLKGPIRESYPSKGHDLLFAGIKRNPIEPSNPKHKNNLRYVYKYQIESDKPSKDAEMVLHRIAVKAFRTEKPNVETYLELFENSLESGESFEEALILAVKALLCSPDFLYFQEGSGVLSDEAIASRLSFFLNRTHPDERLMSLAKQGKLRDKGVLKSELHRLLAKPEATRFVKDFTDAWLNLRDMDFTEPDKKIFPEFADYLRYSMPIESQAFFKEVLDSNLSVSNFIKSDFTVINDRLAELYELDGVEGPAFRKVRLPKDSVRGGVLAQASVHKVSANGTNTSPVVRGVWVMERVLGKVPPPPPPGIPGVEPDIRGASTLREILEKHRDSPNCNACHQKIDPLGFALESFSPIGVYRENFRTKQGKGQRIQPRVHGSWASYYMGPAVDASGEFSDGRSFETFNEFRHHLLKDTDLVAKSLVKKLLTFSTGRDMGFSDRKDIDEIVKKLAKKEYRLADLFEEVVTSNIFLMK